MPKPPGSMTPVRPRRLSSEKNFFVPSTCSSNEGLGSRAKSAVMVGVLPLMAPLKFPLTSRSSLPAGGTSLSSRMASASKPFGFSIAER